MNYVVAFLETIGGRFADLPTWRRKSPTLFRVPRRCRGPLVRASAELNNASPLKHDLRRKRTFGLGVCRRV